MIEVLPLYAPRLTKPTALESQNDQNATILILRIIGVVDLDSIACFTAVADTLLFRAAAARVHLSPAAFSDRIRRLEEEMGAPLLLRSTRRVRLTDAGQRLLPLARQVLASVEALRAGAAGADRPLPFELVVGTRYELGLSWLCPALEALGRKCPERTIHLYNGDTPDLLSRLARGELDAVVASMRLTGPHLRYAALHPEVYALVATERRLRRREDSQRLTLVDVSPDLPLFRYFLDALADATPWPFARTEYLGGIGNIRRRLLDGDGRVAVLPRYFIEPDLASGKLVRLMPRVRLRSDSFRLVWRANHPRETDLVRLAADLRAHPLR
jgi:LysR family glycine cleavage system transcriptional activator